jgi:hypothetical protein
MTDADVPVAPPPSQSPEGLELWIDPGDASAEVVAEVLVALSELYRAEGGAGLVFTTDGEYVLPVEAER